MNHDDLRMLDRHWSISFFMHNWSEKYQHQTFFFRKSLDHNPSLVICAYDSPTRRTLNVQCNLAKVNKLLSTAISLPPQTKRAVHKSPLELPYLLFLGSGNPKVFF
jgi:hypothetical protein